MSEESQDITFAPQSGPQTAFAQNDADIVIMGGAKGGGKTFALLLECVRHVDNKDFAAVIFRRTYPQINQEGGLWDTSEHIYPYAGATGSRGNLSWYFPSGATVTFRHMENEQDRYSWQGAQIPLICFDQLETFTEKMFFFLFGTNRSMCGVRPYIRATCNPEPGWLSSLLSWWWSPDTGYPIAERSGKTRYFVRVNDTLKWGSTKETLESAYPGTRAKSLCFIAAYAQDNKILMDADPGYLSNLMALPLVERERYLMGNWKIRPTAGTIFNRIWFAGKIVPAAPATMSEVVRFWDMAATAPKKGRDPDWACGVKIGTFNGQFFVMDVRRFRKTAHEGEQEVRIAADVDGPNVAVRMEEEGGSSGIIVTSHYQRNVLPGFNFDGIKPRKEKIQRWHGLSSALQAGNLFLVEGHWNQDFIDELDQCRGEDEKNDQADAASGAFNYLRDSGGAMASVVDHRAEYERIGVGRINRKGLW